MKLLGLTGFPLEHSYSREYFLSKFFKEGMSGIDYINYPIEDISSITEIIKSNPELIGFNVTFPHKENILSFIDEKDKTVEATGAANTICILREGASFKLRGYNTDVTGFRFLLKGQGSINNSNALILGTGGASKAVRFALEELNISVTYVSRSKKTSDTILYSDLNNSILQNSKLIINTTPVGMFPDTKDYPEIPYQYINNNNIVIDLIYNPSETEFLRKCKKQGAATVNGLEMLQRQADEAWRIWKDTFNLK